MAKRRKVIKKQEDEKENNNNNSKRQKTKKKEENTNPVWKCFGGLSEFFVSEKRYSHFYNTSNVRNIVFDLFLESEILPVTYPIRRNPGDENFMNMGPSLVRQDIEWMKKSSTVSNTGEIHLLVLTKGYTPDSLASIQEKWEKFVSKLSNPCGRDFKDTRINSTDFGNYVTRIYTQYAKIKSELVSNPDLFGKRFHTMPCNINYSESTVENLDIQIKKSDYELHLKRLGMKESTWRQMQYLWVSLSRKIDYIYNLFGNESSLFVAESITPNEYSTMKLFIPKQMSSQQNRQLSILICLQLSKTYSETLPVINRFIEECNPSNLVLSEDGKGYLDTLRESAKNFKILDYWDRLERKYVYQALKTKITSYIYGIISKFWTKEKNIYWDYDMKKSNNQDQKINVAATEIVSMLAVMNSQFRNTGIVLEGWFESPSTAQSHFLKILDIQKQCFNEKRLVYSINPILTEESDAGSIISSVPLCPFFYPHDLILPFEIAEYSAPGQKRGTSIHKISAFLWPDMIAVSTPIMEHWRTDQTYLMDDTYNMDVKKARLRMNDEDCLFNDWMYDDVREIRKNFDVRKSLGWDYPCGAIIPNGEHEEPTILSGLIGEYCWYPPSKSIKNTEQEPEIDYYRLKTGIKVPKISEKTFYIFPLDGSHPFNSSKSKKGYVSILSVRINISPFLISSENLKEENVGQSGKTWIFNLNLCARKIEKLDQSIDILRKTDCRGYSEKISLANSPHSWFSHNSGSIANRRPPESFSTYRVERIVCPYIIQIDTIQERFGNCDTDNHYDFVNLIFKCIFWTFLEFDVQREGSSNEKSEESDTSSIHNLKSAEEFLLLIDLEEVKSNVKTADLIYALNYWLDFSYVGPKSSGNSTFDSEYDDEKAHWIYSVVGRSDTGKPILYNYQMNNTKKTYLLRPMPSHKEAHLFYQRFTAPFWSQLLKCEGFGTSIESPIQLFYTVKLAYKSKIHAKAETGGSEQVQYKGGNQSKLFNYKFLKHDGAWYKSKKSQFEKKDNNKIVFQIIPLYAELWKKSNGTDENLVKDDLDCWDFQNPRALIVSENSFNLFKNPDLEPENNSRDESIFAFHLGPDFIPHNSIDPISIQSSSEKEMRLSSMNLFMDKIYKKIEEFEYLDFTDFPQMLECFVYDYSLFSLEKSNTHPLDLHSWRALSYYSKSEISSKLSNQTFCIDNEFGMIAIKNLIKPYKNEIKEAQKVAIEKTRNYLLLKISELIKENDSIRTVSNLVVNDINNLMVSMCEDIYSNTKAQRNMAINGFLNIQIELCNDGDCYNEEIDLLEIHKMLLNCKFTKLYYPLNFICKFINPLPMPAILWRYLSIIEKMLSSNDLNCELSKMRFKQYMNIFKEAVKFSDLEIFSMSEWFPKIRRFNIKMYNETLRLIWEKFCHNFISLTPKEKIIIESINPSFSCNFVKEVAFALYSSNDKDYLECWGHTLEFIPDAEMLRFSPLKVDFSQKYLNFGDELQVEFSSRIPLKQLMIRSMYSYNSICNKVFNLIANKNDLLIGSEIADIRFKQIDIMDSRVSYFPRFLTQKRLQNTIAWGEPISSKTGDLLVKQCLKPLSAEDIIIESQRNKHSGKSSTCKKNKRQLHTCIKKNRPLLLEDAPLCLTE